MVLLFWLLRVPCAARDSPDGQHITAAVTTVTNMPDAQLWAMLCLRARTGSVWWQVLWKSAVQNFGCTASSGAKCSGWVGLWEQKQAKEQDHSCLGQDSPLHPVETAMKTDYSNTHKQKGLHWHPLCMLLNAYNAEASTFIWGSQVYRQVHSWLRDQISMLIRMCVNICINSLSWWGFKKNTVLQK